MGVHFCGWCNDMSSGGFCDDCGKAFEKMEKEFKSIIPSKAWTMYVKLASAIGGCD